MIFHVYEDKASQWRWHLKANNHKIIADSGQGYGSKVDCLHAIALVKSSSDAEITEITGESASCYKILANLELIKEKLA